MTDQELIQELRTRIEAYQQAIRALQQSCGAERRAAAVVVEHRNTSQNLNGTGYTARVAGALQTDRWMTVPEIATVTGVEAPRVRAVLYSRTRGQLGIEARKVGGRAEFRRRASS